MRTFLIGIVCLFLTTAAICQNNTEPELKPRVSTPVQDLPSPGGDQKIAPDTPIITINGLCADSNAKGADCKTVITRAEFEKAVDAVAPNMPKLQQKQFATRYAAATILAHKAHELGLDKGPAFDEQLYLAKLQLLAKLADEEIIKQAANVPESEIENYYKQHSSEFQTISYDKLYVPKQKQSGEPQKPGMQGKPAAANTAASEPAMKAEADKLRARAAAGEDFTKLQQEAYDLAGLKLKATNTRVNNVAKTALMPQDASIFDLKPGEVSQVITDPQAFMIYKVISKQDRPLADVKPEIVNMIQRQKVSEFNQSLQQQATEKTTYDNAYFAVPAAPSLRGPGEQPPSAAPGTPAPGKK